MLGNEPSIYTHKKIAMDLCESQERPLPLLKTEFCQYAHTHKKTDVCTHQAVMVQRSN